MGKDEVFVEEIARVCAPQTRAQTEEGERLGGVPGRAAPGDPGSVQTLLSVPPILIALWGVFCGVYEKISLFLDKRRDGDHNYVPLALEKFSLFFF